MASWNRARRLLPRSITGRLIALLLVVLVPLLLLQVGVYYQRFEAARSAQIESNLQLARSSADTFTAYVADVLHDETSVGRAFVLSPTLPSGEMNRLLADSIQQYPSLRKYRWISPEGVVIAGSDSTEVGENVADRAYFIAIKQGQDSIISDLFQLPGDGEPIFVIASGIRDSEGVLQGLVEAQVIPDRLGDALRVGRSGGASVAIHDSHGHIIYISRHVPIPMSWDDRGVVLALPALTQALGGKEASTDSFVGLDHLPRMGSFVPIPLTGGVVGATRPVTEVMAPFWDDLLRASGLLVVVSVGAFLAALYLSKNITVSVRQLQRRAEKVANGEFCATESVTGPAEVEDLARTLDRMAEQLQSREGQLRESEGRLRLLLDSTDEGIFGLDLDGRCSFVNRAAARILGYDPEELLGRMVHDTIHYRYPDGSPYPISECPLFRTLRDGRGARVASEVLWRNDGSPVPVEYASYPIVDGSEKRGAMVTFIDITERRTAAQERERLLAEVQRRAAELDGTIASIADGVMIYGPDGGIVRMNAAAEALFGFNEGERKLPLSERLALLRAETEDGRPAPPEQHPVYRALRGETVRGVVLAAHRPDRSFWVSVSAAPIRSSEGRLHGAVSIVTDITELHELQEMREEFMRMVSHDLRNPLTVIQGQAQMLERSLASTGIDGQPVRSAEAILTSAHRMDAMIQDLVEAGRIGAGQMRIHVQPLDIGWFLSDLKDRMAGVDGSERMRVVVAKDVPLVLADPDPLERILNNLLSNATKYSTQGTQISISVHRHDAEVVVSVADQGPGIPAHMLSHIFERYYRTSLARERKEGLGLGLYITKGLVEALGGRIWAKSEVGKGSTFYFTLPVSP